ncbi:MAG: phage head morphogenesis protein [Campylobacteraceae bacterium]|jgi:hypothetical protein|nr:phage head morphogenesis protein [Campylobacteraceae bacterium]
MAKRTINGFTRQQEAAIIRNNIDALTRKYAPAFQKEIIRATREGAKLYEENLSVDLLLAKHQNKIDRILTSLWIESSQNIRQILSRRKDDRFIMGIVEFIKIYGVTKVTEITFTTVKNIKDAISKGIKEGLGIAETAREIRKNAPEISKIRSNTIARTEIHQASNTANMQLTKELANELGIEMVKEWVGSHDERVRDTHAEADRQTVGLNENFIVGGEELAYPGDPNGSAENVINCRCAVVSVPKE